MAWVAEEETSGRVAWTQTDAEDEQGCNFLSNIGEVEIIER